MTTQEIAQQIAQAAPGRATAEELMELVRLELGDTLETFQAHGKHKTRALAPAFILHILSGNTPEAAFQSVVRGLLLGSHNLCKLPSEGLPELEGFRDALPSGLAARLEFSPVLPDDWLKKANAVVVFGNDTTVQHFRNLTRPDQRFIAHGHKVSFGVVFEDSRFASAPAAAKDTSLFDQQGCLSPHLFYVRHDARGYAAALAREMELFNQQYPRAPLNPAEAASIASIRQETAFAAANGEDVDIHTSPNSTAWTVVYEGNPLFRASCLNRVVFVKPFPEDWEEAIAPVRPHLSTIGYWPAKMPEIESLLLPLGASRLCPIGTMQNPHWTWHQDGLESLASLVSWVDFET